MAERARAFMDPADAPGDTGPDDVVLLQQLRDGDDAALSTLHERHARAVYLVACSRLSSAADAEEATQDAFLLLWKKCRRIDLVGTSCLPWLLTTVNYVAGNSQRAHARRARHFTEMAAELTSAQEVEPEALRRIELRQVEQIVATLPQIDQDVFRLCTVDGLSYKQAAHQLRTSHAVVRNRLSRVRGTLRKQMDR